VDTILGLVGVVIWIVSVIGIAAGVTWLVVKLLPGDKPQAPSGSAEATGSG
jgi:hypothetical protein